MKSIQTDFKAHLRQNPAFFEKFKQTAISLVKSRKMARISSKSIFELIRITTGEKIDNRFSSRYSRMLISLRPEFKNKFEFRRISS